MYYILILDMFRAILCSSSGGQNYIVTASGIVTRPYSAPVESGLQCKNMLEPARSQITIWGMRIECWIPKASFIHAEYVTRTRLNVAVYVRCQSCFIFLIEPTGTYFGTSQIRHQ
jgi:ribosomal protein S27E